MNWEAFKEVFLRKYFPLTERVKMETQFLELRQKEGDSLADYEAKFVQLSRYAPHLVINPQSKMERFKCGLKPVIRRAICTMRCQSFEELVEGAREFEKENLNFIMS